MLQLEEGLKGKKSIITSDQAFILRYADSGFKSKWSGFWVPPLKVMDYFAYKINGEWLSPSNVSKFQLKPELGIWNYRLSNLEVKEHLIVVNKGFISILDIKNCTDDKKAVSICLESALDFRPRSEDVVDVNYQTTFSAVRSAVKVIDKDSDLCAMFGRAKGSEGQAEWRPEGQYKEHFPGKKQICYLPGTYKVGVKLEAGESLQVPFVFSFSQEGDVRDNFDSLLNCWSGLLADKQAGTSYDNQLNTPSETLNQAFKWCQVSLNDLKFSVAGSDRLFAGLPWFQADWGRDSLWSLLGLIDLGQFNFVERYLQRLAQRREGRIPNRIDLQGGANYSGSDSDPLFLIALDYYQQVSGKEEFLSGNQIEACFNSLSLDNDLVQHEPQATWMDTLERGQSAIEIQALWLEAARRYDRDCKKSLEKGLDRYWDPDNNYFFDSFVDRSPLAVKTINAAVPLFFGQIDQNRAKKALRVIGGEFTTNYGVRTLSYLEDNYNPQAYHEGACWFLVTLWAAAANLKYGRTKEGVSLLSKAAKDIYRGQLGGISECLNSKTGEMIGCSSQAWSEALFLHVIDRFLLGIKPKLDSNELIIKPQLPSSWDNVERRQKKIGGYVFDLSLSRQQQQVSLQLDFDQEPEMKLKVPTDKKVKINGEVTEEANLQQENTVELLD